MLKYDVSIIVLTYNPNVNDLIRTLYSCYIQRNVSFEIIVTDDGSDNSIEEIVKSFFDEHGFKDYRIIEHTVNQGTVKNFLSAINNAEGNYIKGISPGDYLYDEECLADFYRYAQKKQSPMVFGNAIYYYNDEHLTIEKNVTSPKVKKPYFPESLDCKKQFERLCLYGDNISGAIAFIRRDIALMLMKIIAEKIKYIEDVSFAILPLTGTSIVYLDRNIIWYQYGTGISTKGDKESRMTKMLRHEQFLFWELVAKEFVTPRYVHRIIKYYQVRMGQKGFWDKVLKTIIAPERNIHIKKIMPNISYDKTVLDKIYLICNDNECV